MDTECQGTSKSLLVALLSQWTCSLRATLVMPGKDECRSAEVERMNRRHKEGPINVLLILACIVFGAASFMFGYDDKVISPVIALPAFVSLSVRSPSKGHID